MRDFFRSLLQHNRLQTARRWVSEKSAPLVAGWRSLTAPIRVWLSPVTEAWGRFTAPARARWAAFRERNPKAGSVLGFLGSVFKWCFYFLLFLVIGVWIGLFGHMPDSDELRNIETANATEIYTADSVLIGKYFIENRTAITLDNISPHIVNALIATEDRRFLEHSGIDVQSWFRVAFGMLSGQESKGGGSTLSQQLAKNLYPRQKYLIPGISLVINKLRENFISIKLERVYNKQELLNLYLNTVPFGDIFGIQVASRQYFNKKPKELTVDQAAMLVGMLKGTTLYNPVRNPENAKKRRNVVMQQMVKNGNLTQKEYEELSVKPVGAKRYTVDSNNDGMGTYFREYLRTDVMPKLLENLKKEDGSDYNLYKDGLKIYTTLNSKMQQYAEEAVQKQMQDLQKQFNQHWKYSANSKEKPWGNDTLLDNQVRRTDRWKSLKEAGMSDADAQKNFQTPVKMTIFSWKNGGSDQDTTMSPIDSVRYYFCMLNCGFMAMDHRNGYVRAWVGGTNFKYFKFDHNLSRRQVGSTFKPIVYAAALQDSIKPSSYFPNEIKKIVDWEPHNADEFYGGYYSMNGALTRSVNVVAAQLIERVGIQKTIDLATKMGITSRLPREYGISLGAADITLYEMMKVYGTIANQGVRPEPVTVVKVVDRDGEVIFDYQKELAKNGELGPHVRALTPDQATLMTEMMQNVINYGTGSRLRRGYGIQGDFAGKTGTTQRQSDGWFICFNPQLVTGAWVGGESPAVRFRSMVLGQGSAMALPIAGWFWHKVANDKKLGKLLTETFPDPRPDLQAQLGGYPWIAIAPDSFNLLIQDTLMRDSLVKMYTTKKDKEDASEAPAEGAPDGEKKDETEGKGNTPGIIRKIFGFKPDGDKKKDQ